MYESDWASMKALMHFAQFYTGLINVEEAMFHFVLKWGAMDFKGDPFPYNIDIIRGNRIYRKFSKEFVLWGKWHEKHPVSGKPRLLEPGLREPYGSREGQEVCELANEAINEGEPVYLYLYNEFFVPSLTIANVVEAFYTGKQLPPPDEDGRPACAHIPFYYLHEKREQECLNCRDEVPKCKMCFSCNFWFKVTDFYFDIPQAHVQDEFHNLVYADGQVAAKGAPYDPWGAASYPICVELYSQEISLIKSLC